MGYFWYRYIGIFIVTLGIGFALSGIINHKVLWNGVTEKTITKFVPVPYQPEPKLPSNQHILQSNTVEFRTEWTSNHLPTGEYQFRDKDNTIRVVKFCDPSPDIHQGTIIDLRYQDNDKDKDCETFVDATIIKDWK
jgi:hypothetical protein